MTIASITITKNEETNIRACLESLKWVDKLIVVDAESTDRTVELAKAYTPKVFVRAWPGYGSQKNFAMDHATADWILMVDADERVTEDLREEILNLLRKYPSPGAPVALHNATGHGEGVGEGERLVCSSEEHGFLYPPTVLLPKCGRGFPVIRPYSTSGSRSAPLGQQTVPSSRLTHTCSK